MSTLTTVTAHSVQISSIKLKIQEQNVCYFAAEQATEISFDVETFRLKNGKMLNEM